ncbi:hypothetical protein GALMADRAFT_150654 [Galerina marginata CBS 339.88]|uniref:Glycoside hydrolase family 105 protein n=1 Tax=Galerina marginata (strain CBS 339.88) TaxID=685588 RepID=A0A067TMK9_GALM3|nr:hypothetical protein GALMADRAFT_150654 [Galerina marginata CBS 339.88]
MSHRNINPLKAQIIGHISNLIKCLVNIEDTTGEYLLTLADGRVIDTKGWNDWEWTHGIGLYGLWQFHEVTGDQNALEICFDWFRDRFEVGTSKNVNTMSPLLTAAYLQGSGLASYGIHLDSWAEWVMYEMPRTEEGGLQHVTYLEENKQQLWDDTLMMTVLPLTKIGLVLGRKEYLEEAKRQFLLHIQYLRDIQTGLWFHGWTFSGRHHFGHVRWARGNCWVTVAIPDFLELLNLPRGDSIHLFLVSTLNAQIDALIGCQDHDSGLWHTILDDPTSYLEASATAGFAYGILKSLRLRLIPKEERYLAASKKAIAGIINNISAGGELMNVSFGTPVFNHAESYKKVPLTSMPYGQSLALLALTEYFRTLL